MTVRSDSRYSQNNLYYAAARDDKTLTLCVDRPLHTDSVGPTNTLITTRPATYMTYTWVFGDRLDALAYRFYGDSCLYWKIADANQNLFDPTTIKPGTVIRIPNA